jgi:hypothetical protein
MVDIRSMKYYSDRFLDYKEHNYHSFLQHLHHKKAWRWEWNLADVMVALKAVVKVDWLVEKSDAMYLDEKLAV